MAKNHKFSLSFKIGHFIFTSFFYCDDNSIIVDFGTPSPGLPVAIVHLFLFCYSYTKHLYFVPQGAQIGWSLGLPDSLRLLLPSYLLSFISPWLLPYLVNYLGDINIFNMFTQYRNIFIRIGSLSFHSDSHAGVQSTKDDQYPVHRICGFNVASTNLFGITFSADFVDLMFI